MANSELPQRTAGDVGLPNGDTVWVCTLNSMLFEEADRRARWVAQSAARGYLKGGAEYDELVARVRSMRVEDQAAVVMQQEYFTLRREVEEKYPDPIEPEQGEATPEQFAKAVIAYEAACEKAVKQRAEQEKKRYDAGMKRTMELTASVRVDRACISHYAQEWGRAFVRQREIETLFRATRLKEDHSRRYFASAAAYEDADDVVQEALREFYFTTLAIPKQEDVPTSPAEP